MKKVIRGMEIFFIYALCITIFVLGISAAYENSSKSAYADTSPPFEYETTDHCVRITIFGNALEISQDDLKDAIKMTRENVKLQMPKKDIGLLSP